LIREMVNVKLFQRGLDARIADHSRIGIPLYDLELVMRAPNKENSNTSISAPRSEPEPLGSGSGHARRPKSNRPSSHRGDTSPGAAS
ncbi:hypothetical protein, partial [Acetomicrobium sp. S15 = DSM 107314]|uniref:hypothetical protein n=1 Tax=Acetomicrobium sp. S15 = DSM 107314 TaxID=2529858 RepID=UPI001E568113